MIIYFSFKSDHDEIIKRHETQEDLVVFSRSNAFRGVLTRFFIYFLQM